MKNRKRGIGRMGMDETPMVFISLPTAGLGTVSTARILYSFHPHISFVVNEDIIPISSAEHRCEFDRVPAGSALKVVNILYSDITIVTFVNEVLGIVQNNFVNWDRVASAP
jgi:hypothetical protein